MSLKVTDYATDASVNITETYSEIIVGGLSIARRYADKVQILNDGASVCSYQFDKMNRAYRKMWEAACYPDRLIADPFDDRKLRAKAKKIKRKKLNELYSQGHKFGRWYWY